MATVAELALKITADMKQAEQAIGSFEQRLTKTGERISSIGRGMSTAFTLPIAAAFGAAGKEFMGLETTLAQMEGLAGVASEEIDGITAAMGRLAGETGKSMQELAKGMYFIRSSGLEGQEALDVLVMAAKASAAGLGETQIIADLLTSALNAYGSENLSAAQATDILVAAVREGKGEASALAGSLGQVMPIASEMGVQFDQVAASVAAMTRTGTSAETASMELKNILSALLKPAAQANEALDAMGLSAAGLRKQIREEGLLSALMTIREATNKFGEDAMAQVFPNIRALMGVLDLMGSNLEDNIAIFGALENSTGALDYAFGKISDTSRHQLNQGLATLTTSLAKLGDTVMDNVVPAIEWASGKVEAFTKWWDSLDESTQNFIVRAGLVVAAIGPMLIVIGGLIKAGGSVIGIVKDLVGGLGSLIDWAGKTGAAIQKTGGVMAWLAANPIGVAIVAIGALIAIGVLLWKNWDEIKEWAQKTWDKISGIIDGAIKGITGWINGLIEGAQRAINWVQNLLGLNAEANATLPTVPSGPSGTGGPVEMAAGGIVTRPTLALIGEAGPEAVVPLRQMGSLPGMTGTQGGGGDVHLHFHGPIYGMLDFESKVTQTIRDAIQGGGFRGVIATP